MKYVRRFLFIFCLYLERLRPRRRHIWYFLLYFPLTQVTAKFILMYYDGFVPGLYLAHMYAFLVSSVCLFIPHYFFSKISTLLNFLYIMSREFIFVVMLFLMYHETENQYNIYIFILAGMMETVFYFMLMKIDTVYKKYIGKARAIRLANVSLLPSTA